MIYISDPPRYSIGAWPFWGDPATKWAIIPNNMGKYWLVSGPAQRKPGNMLYTHPNEP